ncbi:MAG: hypothetical protein ACHP7A_00100 [Caulobacterales bacterium]
MLALGAAAVAKGQDENPTTPGAIANPGSYQGSMALQQQEQQQAQQIQQQNSQMLRRMDQTYGQYAPGRGGARAGAPPPNLWNKPPLPPAKNPLLGRWRQGAHREAAATRQFGGEIASIVNGAMAGGCDSIFGKGVVAFEPDALQWVAPDGHEEILNHVSYRASGEDVAVLTRDPGALPAMFIGFTNHDHAVVGVLNCTLERVGAQRAALTRPGPPTAGIGPAHPSTAVAAAGAFLDVSVGAVAAPLTNARVWITRENPAFALSRAGYPVASESAALDTMAANCGTPQACLKVLQAIGQIAIQSAKTDAAGHAALQPPAAGRYYVVGFSPYRDKAIVWVQPLDYRAGPAAVRLDIATGRPVG